MQRWGLVVAHQVTKPVQILWALLSQGSLAIALSQPVLSMSSDRLSLLILTLWKSLSTQDLAVTIVAETRATCLGWSHSVSSADRHVTLTFLQYRNMQLIEICISGLDTPRIRCQLLFVMDFPSPEKMIFMIK